MRSALTARAVTWSSESYSFDSSARARTTVTLVKLELVDLTLEPRDPALHRLDERERHIGSNDRQHESGKPGARSDIADAAGPQQGCDERAVQDVACPEAGEFERADQAEFLTVARERGRECASGFEVLAEEFGGCSRLGLESVGHRFT